jgi:hypothetical protein
MIMPKADSRTTKDPNEECCDPNCRMSKWHHRLRDCDIELLTEQAKRLNYPYPLPEDADA